MANKMLIDATHPEETRVVVVNGNRVDEFDFESESRKQLRGNIYLAKITRVEPSLQAAFVEYGGNRHGFLAFSEIHPDYYQIPVADREALVKHQAAQARRAAEEENADDDDEPQRSKAQAAEASSNTDTLDAPHDDHPVEEAGAGDTSHHDDDAHHDEAHGDDAHSDDAEHAASAAAVERGETETVHSDETVEALGAEDPHEEAQADAEPRKQRHNFRNYKIQEVVKRRQIMLVQVVKEERGNKGAALTTFLSLAGRYCVLMPNTARGGGISRKITVAADRKKLKAIAESLDVPEGMGLIIRTAGAKRTKAEIKRDYEYLLRMWESVRELTLRSTAPALVYEEGSLIKRSIRDLYDKDIDTIFVEGDEGYKEAKGFMRMLMPSHAKNVQQYKDKQPLFQKFQVEQQLDSMFNPTVTLKSGGSIVINPTEALVSIDVNSGRSTKERNIEQTALRTNLEAAEEVSRQMRLRDLAGLVVIDFIDMDENRNNRAVERKLKDCLKTDRARIQVGRISHFGLMEMSRQRMRSGVLEGSTVTCSHCMGTGIVRSVESMALHVLRGVEAEAIKGRAAAFTAKVPVDVAVYILNQKRSNLLDIEERYGTSVYIEADPTLKGSEHRVEQAEARALTRTRPAAGAINIENTYSDEEEDLVVEDAIDEEEDDEEAAEAAPAQARETRGGEGRGEARGDEQGPRKRRRRRRKKKNEDGSDAAGPSGEAQDEGDDEDDEAAPQEAGAPAEAADGEGNAEGGEGGEDRPRKRRRRGRRGGRRNRRDADGKLIVEAGDGEAPANGEAEAEDDDEEGDDEAPVLLSYSRDDTMPVRDEATAARSEPEPEAAPSEPEPLEIPVMAEAEQPAPAPDEVEVEAERPAPEPVKAEGPARRGWWQRRTE
ncbi:MAG: Rne/Rng family ribonuclease [Parvibaculum sp.]|uniref:Rne/Rng family ribonuclease n=1 Tax=Parvibaculum sp. TaxID=2024848 RepID=UPI0025EAFC0D|nr:Rne/Rng family ribonuclease [Parvibaculum sp.]MCE9650388.1 Rne/Rng family ribonuclease [Parvibaculum sp.]